MGRFDKIIEFEKRMAESDGFDIEKLMHLKPDDYEYVVGVYNKGPYSTDIHLYAKMGIHKYNLQKGTNLQFSSVKKYNEHSCSVYCAYYITLVAKDGASLVPFQTKVIKQHWEMNLTCHIARPKGQPLDDSWTQDDDEYPEDDKLPKWPSENDAFKDKSRYYVVKKSGREKHDWIRMYMELAFLKANIKAKNKIKKPELSKLSFVKVAVESPKKVERPRDRLKAANATFYIKYMYRQPDMSPLYGIAVIRRTVDKDYGAFTLMFDTCLVGTKEEGLSHGS